MRRVARRQVPWRRAGAAAAAVAFTALVGGLIAGGSELYLVSLLAACWCAVSAWRRAGKASGIHRAGWTSVAVGSGFAGYGQAWWLINSPSSAAVWADLPGHAGMIGAMTGFLVAVICLRPPRREEAGSTVLVLDIVIVTATLFAAIWSLMLAPVSDGKPAITGREAAAAIHAVVGGLLLLTLFVIALRLPSGGGRRSAELLVVGPSCVALANFVWVIAWIYARPHGIAVGSAGAAVSFTLLALALGRERRRDDQDVALDDGDPGTEASWRLWLLYPPVLLLWLIVGEAAVGTPRHEEDSITVLGSLVVIAIVLVRQGVAIRDARHLAAQLRDQSDRDPLTNLINHRKLHERLDRELERARRGDYPLAVALIDVDRFKQINDQLGHVVGDHVLRAIASTLARACRGTDVAARYAGDEFALILPGLDAASAAAVGNRLLDEVAGLAYWPGPDAEQPVSISVGLAISRHARRSGRQLIAAADEGLYLAKHAGRNRCAVIDADVFEPDDEPAVDLRRLFTVHPAECRLEELPDEETKQAADADHDDERQDESEEGFLLESELVDTRAIPDLVNRAVILLIRLVHCTFSVRTRRSQTAPSAFRATRDHIVPASRR